MALPRCCHSVTRSRAKLQCKQENEGRIQEALLRSLVLTWRLTYLWLSSGPSIARVGSWPSGRRRWAQVALQRRPACQHIGSSRECTAALAGWEVPTALTGLLAPSTVVPQSRRSPAPWSGYEAGRAAQKVSAKVVLVWLWLMLGATDRICEQTTEQAGQESHVGKGAQSAKAQRWLTTHTSACRRHRPGMAMVVAVAQPPAAAIVAASIAVAVVTSAGVVSAGSQMTG